MRGNEREGRTGEGVRMIRAVKGRWAGQERERKGESRRIERERKDRYEIDEGK